MTPLTVDKLPSLDKAALFFDIDGTLAPIAAHASQVYIDESMLTTIRLLHRATEGALAVLSGRPIEQIDRLFSPYKYPAAAEHGALVRDPDGVTHTESHLAAHLDQIYRRALDAVRLMPGVHVEQKHHGVALHYRQAPRYERAVIQVANTLVALAPGIEATRGKMVVELKSATVNKGVAMQSLLSHAPFHDRIPVVFGDDMSDEPAFMQANRLNGLSISIETQASCAQHYVPRQHGLEQLLSDWLCGQAS